MVDNLRAVLRLAAGREAEHSGAIIDRRTLRSILESGERADHDGRKLKKGSKIHISVDTLGHLFALHVTAASAEGRGQVEGLACAVQAVTDSHAEIARVDQGYTGEHTANAAESLNGHSHEELASSASSKTMSIVLKHSPDFTSSLSPAL